MDFAAAGRSINFGLAGRVCLITGGAQGIGAACARRFFQDGAQVIVLDVDTVRGQQVADQVAGCFVACDVGDSKQISDAVAEATRYHGRIDVLVNNAGIARPADLLDVTEDDFDAVLNVNLKGPFLMAQAVARQMVSAGRGSMTHYTMSS